MYMLTVVLRETGSADEALVVDNTPHIDGIVYVMYIYVYSCVTGDGFGR